MVLVLAASCADVVRYTHELNDPSSGRSLFVTTPASLGALCGFVAGVPVDVAALPVTLPIYLLQDDEESPADPLSTMLLPSFVLWRAGTLVAMPFDAVEFVAWRMWQPPETMSGEEREEWESRLDRKALPTYSVEWAYPRKPSADPPALQPALAPDRGAAPLPDQRPRLERQ